MGRVSLVVLALGLVLLAAPAARADDVRDLLAEVDMPVQVDTPVQGLRTCNQAVRLWDTESGQLKAKLEGHARGVTTLAYSPDGKKLVTGSSDGKTRLWDAQTGKLVW